MRNQQEQGNYRRCFLIKEPVERVNFFRRRAVSSISQSSLISFLEALMKQIEIPDRWLG